MARSNHEQGVARIDKELHAAGTPCALNEQEETAGDHPQMGALRNLDSGLFAFVHTDADMTFVHSSWNQGIEPGGSGWPKTCSWFTHALRAHTVLDRSLFRAGETVHMKHFIRRQSSSGLEYPAAGLLPKVAVIGRIGSHESYELPLVWDQAAGVAEVTWRIPDKATLGNYSITLYKDASNGTRSVLDYCDDCWFTGQFKVAEFRVPLIKAVVQGPEEPLVQAVETDLNIHLGYLAGGNAGANWLRCEI